MDIARCLIDGEIYQAHVFSQLPLGEREAKRQELICPNDDCKGPAFFRREARTGQAACFGARHVDGCNMAAAEPVRLQGAEGDEEDYLFNPGDRLEIDLGYGAHVRVNVQMGRMRKGVGAQQGTLGMELAQMPSSGKDFSHC